MAKYTIKDRSGNTVREVPGVLDTVTLSSVETSSGSNLVTVASTTGLHPGMAVAIPNVPRGAFIHSVKSSTVIELWASKWNDSTGVWSTAAANANATATATGMTGHAMGFNPVPVSELYAEGCWRNLHDSSNHNALPATFTATMTDGAAVYGTHGFGRGFRLLPTAGTVTAGVYAPSAYEIIKSDDLAVTPLKRHEGVPRGTWILVSTGGHRTAHVINPGDSCGYTGADD